MSKYKIETILEALDIDWDEIVTKFKINKLTNYVRSNKK